MKWKPWVLALLLVPVMSLQGQITVNTDFTAAELVTDILVNNGCAQTANHTSFTGDTFGFDGIGFFSAANTDFPFEQGIILSTGRAEDAAGGNFTQNTSGIAEWRGDADLSRVTNRQELFNASFLQFDFVPLTNQISFNFIFASEEYFGEFQCNFSDVFAFILTDPSGMSTNLAIVPNTNEPISVTTIRPGVDGVCVARNQDFFAGINNAISDISFHGNTVSLQAVSEVIPGVTYNIKLVIADNLDTELDSAVFLEAGSFNIDVDIGEDRLVSLGNPLCTNEQLELDATSMGAMSYRWFRNGTEILKFRDIPVVTVEESGEYTVEIEFSSICISNGQILVEFVDPPIIADTPTDLVLCETDNNGQELFDLRSNIDLILGDQDNDIYQVTFYRTMEDAVQFENQINAIAYQNEALNETIFARISSGTSCFEIVQFQISLQSLALGNNTLAPSYPLCRDTSQNAIAPFPELATGLSETTNNFTWFLEEAIGENRILGENGSSLIVSQEGTYVVQVENIQFGCSFFFSTQVVPVDPPTLFEIEFLTDLFSNSNDISIVVEGNSEYLFSVDGGPFTEENRFNGLLPGEHVAEVTDIEGCTVQSKTFEIIDYPRFFTPNGDDVNDQWQIVGGSGLDNAQVSIFDRFGKLIRTLTSDESWDGTFNGNSLPASDYWFSIAYERDGIPKVFNAHFALKR